MDRHRFAQPARRQLHAAFESARDLPHERDPVAVVGVHVRLDLEDEASDLVAGRRDLLISRRLWTRRGRVFRNRLDQLGDAEILQGRSEIDRGQIAIAIGFQIKFGIADLRQFDVFREALGDLRIAVARAEEFLARSLRPRDAAAGEIEHAFELAAHADRIGLRADIEREHVRDLVEQLEYGAALAVDLVDEGDDRHAAQAADLEQLARLRLDTLGGIDHHDRAVDSGQRAVGVFGEVFVPRRVEQVEGDAFAFEGHDRAGHRDAALLFDLHPVRPRAPRLSARLDLARQMDRAAGQQQLFGERGLARVGVRNDREGTAVRHFNFPRHSRAGGNPDNISTGGKVGWTPAVAGVTVSGALSPPESRRNPGSPASVRAG